MLVNKKSTTDLSKKKRRRRVLLIQCHVAVANTFFRMIDMLTSVHLSYFYSLYSTRAQWDLHSDLIHDPHTGFGGATVVEGGIGPKLHWLSCCYSNMLNVWLKQSVCVYLLKKKSFKRSKKEISRRVTAQKHPSKELSELLLEMPWQYRT